MEARKFERTRAAYVNMMYKISFTSAILLVVVAICSVLCDKYLNGMNMMVASTVLMILSIILGIVSMLMPDDFEYIIRKKNDVILFEFDTDDVRCFDKNLRIIFQTKRYLILEDDYSRIKIAYNAAVLKFLKELGA